MAELLDALKQQGKQMAMTTTVTRANGDREERVQAYWSRDPRRLAIVDALLRRGHVLTERQVYTEPTLGLLWRLVKGQR